MKYHPERPFDNTTGETYLEQIGTPMYEEDGFQFDIPRAKLVDKSWKYKPEDWVPKNYKNRQATKTEINHESETEDDDYNYNSEMNSSDEDCEPDESSNDPELDEYNYNLDMTSRAFHNFKKNKKLT